MGDTIQFTSNVTDHCTDTGFQFEFHCDRCHSGYKTRFSTFAAGAAASVLSAASDLFGGIFGKARQVSERARSATWHQARDRAFAKAVEEVKPSFIQCPRCNAWVCRERCWSQKKGLCKNCAPDLGVEMAAAQASKSVEEVWAHAAMAEEDKKLHREVWREGIVASCPNCEKPLAQNAKFCPECGFALKKKDVCPECGAKLSPGAKFCPECGHKIA
jgi:membrane protease subunit (stomatin/prohibitin family)